LNPLKIKTDGMARIQWQLFDKPTNRFIYRVLDLDHYQESMTEAMRTLLSTLPYSDSPGIEDVQTVFSASTGMMPGIF
jgi:hypothetical protein